MAAFTHDHVNAVHAPGEEDCLLQNSIEQLLYLLLSVNYAIIKTTATCWNEKAVDPDTRHCAKMKFESADSSMIQIRICNAMRT